MESEYAMNFGNNRSQKVGYSQAISIMLSMFGAWSLSKAVSEKQNV